MSKKIEEIIRGCIKTEYRKYHDTPVDFMETAALKIVESINLRENELQSKLTELGQDNERLRDSFTIDDAKDMVNAWESLEGDRNYSPKDIERWLVNDMKPMIDKFRAKIANKINK